MNKKMFGEHITNVDRTETDSTCGGLPVSLFVFTAPVLSVSENLMFQKLDLGLNKKP